MAKGAKSEALGAKVKVLGGGWKDQGAKSDAPEPKSVSQVGSSKNKLEPKLKARGVKLEAPEAKLEALGAKLKAPGAKFQTLGA